MKNKIICGILAGVMVAFGITIIVLQVAFLAIPIKVETIRESRLVEDWNTYLGFDDWRLRKVSTHISGRNAGIHQHRQCDADNKSHCQKLALRKSPQPAITADGQMSISESPYFAANDLWFREIGDHPYLRYSLESGDSNRSNLVSNSPTFRLALNN
jgi:hypothetical protein